MAILSKRMMGMVERDYADSFGLSVQFMDVSGAALNGEAPLGALRNMARRRRYALQQSVNLGEPYFFLAAPSVLTWVVGLEDCSMVHGGIVGGEVWVDETSLSAQPGSVGTRSTCLRYLIDQGMPSADAASYLHRLPSWQDDRALEAANALQESFYKISGWKPELMEANRLRQQQQEQLRRAIEDQRRGGDGALYAFEKERMLLANIRSGDRNGARRILNEMLATIYMSNARLVVLRARTIELLSCLTRAAIEDNPLLEPLIERNHRWTEQLVRAESFESLSQVLMEALDDFIDGIYLHGSNRSNSKVAQAVAFINDNHASKISLKEVACAIGLSPCRTAHLVKQYTGRTVVQIIHEVRIRHAQQLLARTSDSCTDIAYSVGFGDQSYFIKQFRRLTGTTPHRYRSAHS